MAIPSEATCLPSLAVAANWIRVFSWEAAMAIDPIDHPWETAIDALWWAEAVLGVSVAAAAEVADFRNRDAEEDGLVEEEMQTVSDRGHHLLF